MRQSAVLVGRFCPITRAHSELICKILDYNEKGIRGFVFVINGDKTSKDVIRNPLSSYKRIEILSKFFPKLKVDIVSSAYEVIDVLDVQGYFPAYWICGSDRIEGYKKLLKHAEINGEVIGIDRENGVASGISGTLAREAAKNADSKLFTSLLPYHKDPLFIKNIMNDIQKGLRDG